MAESQRDPEAMLARLRTEEPQAAGVGDARRRGQLKIFFGYAAGVGKTYTMLESARVAANAGREIVLGYIEPHDRPETEALQVGLDQLPHLEIPYRGVNLHEFDLDAALKRRPEVILVDELAHSNAPGCRHVKRWQDVWELLEVGSDVWTTLNVQHIESLNDVVAQITGVTVRETIPDHVFDEAAEVEIVDLPPDELLERFREGRVYVTEQVERAAQSFFRKANLIALREIAIRRVADRVGRQVETARLGQARRQTWATRERLLVCVGPSPTSAKVIRTAKRMASAMHAEWIAVHAETTRDRRLDERGGHRLTMHLKLAQELGAEVVTLTGEDIATEIVNFALSRNATKIVIGKTGASKWYHVWRPSVVDRLIARSGDIDVYVIRGVEEKRSATQPAVAKQLNWPAYAAAAGVMAVATAVAGAFEALGLADANLVMTFLLGVIFVAVYLGRGPAIASSFAAVLLFNFFFTEPYYTFRVSDTQYLFTFLVMFAIAILVSTLTARIRDRAELSRGRERSTGELYRVSRRLAATSGTLQIVAAVQEQLSEIVGGDVAVLLPEGGTLRLAPGPGWDKAMSESELAVARWVFEHRQAAGHGTQTLPNAEALHLPLIGPESTLGVLAVRPKRNDRILDVERRQILEAFATLVAMALERDRLAQEAQRILAQAEAEKLRSSLLSTVSHDLRTPLATIAGASSSLIEKDNLPPAMRRELLQSIYEEADRLSRLVENLLHMTRIESGSLKVDKQWQPLDEVVGTALRRMDRTLERYTVSTHLPADLLMVPLDGLLIEQVLINLLENAVRYSPPDAPIDIFARVASDEVEVAVKDRGRGVPAGEREQVFEKFYRGSARPSHADRGVGLGLAICQGIVQAHGGRIWTEPREGRGTSFLFTLPLEGQPPSVAAELPASAERQ